MHYTFFIALRYIRSRKRGVFALLTSIIAVAGVTLGVGALIVTLSVMNGFRSDIQEKILGTQAHIVVTGRTEEPSDIAEVRGKLERFPGVTAAAPFVYGQGILKAGQTSVGSVIKGIDPVQELKTTNLASKITEGSFASLGEPDNKAIILGVELAKNAGAKIGDEVVIVSPHGVSTPFGNMPRMGVFRVAGIFHVGMYDYDANLAFVSLAQAQQLFDMKNAVSGFGVKISDLYQAETFARKLGLYLGYQFSARSWIEMNKNLFSALKLEKTVMFIILTLIILVAAFNIISNLFLLTMEEYRDIGVLRALGAHIRDIKWIFMIEGMITGFMGIVLGSALGSIISLALDHYEIIKLPADVYYIETLPVKMMWTDVGMVMGVAFLIAFLSTIYPAAKAARVDPVEAIRYG